MSTEGAALAHLRDVYYILTHDLADVQLDKLRDACALDATSMDNALKIAPVVTRLAIPMLDFNVSVEAVNQLTSQGMTQARLLIGVDIVLILLVVIMILLVMCTLTWFRYKEGRLDPWSMVPELGRVYISGLIFLAFLAVWLIMIRAGRDELGHNSDILKTGYWNIHNHVGAAYPMRFSAAIQQGTVSVFVLNQNPSEYGGSTLVPGPDCENDAEETDQAPSCHRIIDPCGSIIPSLAEVITKCCPNEVFHMLDTLQTIKTEGVDAYDRGALWGTITSGVEAIRMTIDVSADANTSATGPAVLLDATAAQGVIETQIVPIMERSDLLALASVKPTPQNQVADSHLVVYQQITSQTLQLLQTLNYQLDISDYKDFLDTSMKAYYATSYPAIRFSLLAIIDTVQKAEDARPPPSANLYVDSGTMIARVKNMGSSSWNNLVSQTDITRAAVRQFLAKFKLPRDQPNTSVNILVVVSAILALVGYMALFMYLTMNLHHIFTKNLDRQTAARYIVSAACLYALLTVIMNSVVSRMRIRSSHNWSTIGKNGQLLANYLDSTEKNAMTIDPSTDVNTSDAQNYIDAAIGTVQSFDACNSVTNGSSIMPFPMMDVVLNLTVIVVVMAGALYGVSYLNPREKLANITTLMRLRERVMNGEVPGGMEQELICCTPNHSVWHITYWIAVAVLFLLNIFVMTTVQNTNDSYNTSLSRTSACV